MEDVPRSVCQKPEDDEVNNDRDPEELAQSRSRALVFQLIHDLQQFMAVKNFVALSSGFSWGLGRCASGICWDFGDGHSERVSGHRYGAGIFFHSLTHARK